MTNPNTTKSNRDRPPSTRNTPNPTATNTHNSFSSLNDSDIDSENVESTTPDPENNENSTTSSTPFDTLKRIGVSDDASKAFTEKFSKLGHFVCMKLSNLEAYFSNIKTYTDVYITLILQLFYYCNLHDKIRYDDLKDLKEDDLLRSTLQREYRQMNGEQVTTTPTQKDNTLDGLKDLLVQRENLSINQEEKVQQLLETMYSKRPLSIQQLETEFSDMT